MKKPPFAQFNDRELAAHARDAYARFLKLVLELRAREYNVEIGGFESVSEEFIPSVGDDVLIFKSVTL